MPPTVGSSSKPGKTDTVPSSKMILSFFGGFDWLVGSVIRCLKLISCTPFILFLLVHVFSLRARYVWMRGLRIWSLEGNVEWLFVVMEIGGGSFAAT